MNIFRIHWRNSDPPDSASDFDSILQDFVREVSVPLNSLTADGWTRGLGRGFQIQIGIPPAMWVPRSDAGAAEFQDSRARVAQKLYGTRVLVVRTPREFAEQLASWWKAAQTAEPSPAS